LPHLRLQLNALQQLKCEALSQNAFALDQLKELQAAAAAFVHLHAIHRTAFAAIPAEYHLPTACRAAQAAAGAGLPVRAIPTVSVVALLALSADRIEDEAQLALAASSDRLEEGRQGTELALRLHGHPARQTLLALQTFATLFPFTTFLAAFRQVTMPTLQALAI
jgi:hypothetical protein